MTHADNKYIIGIRDNDEQVIKEIYQHYYPVIKAMIKANGGNEPDAADIFQEALLSIFRQVKQSSFVLTCPMEAYLYIICKNKWISRQKTLYHQKVTFVDSGSYTIAEDVFAQAEAMAVEGEKRNLLLKKIAALEESCRTLLQLCWQGTPLEKIAQQLNTTYAYVRKRKSLCTGRLLDMVQLSDEYKYLKL